uniref:MARVEL domain-containing protein n=1 Tax=Aureoumbra lagunensis TaxID=44058 RepID=A0A7S3JVH0_9STRA
MALTDNKSEAPVNPTQAEEDPVEQAPAPAAKAMNAQKLLRLVMGGVCFIAFIFSCATIGVPLWSYGEYTVFSRTVEITIGLWRVNTVVEDGKDDDSALKKKDLDEKKTETWNTIEFNRTAVVMSFLLTFFSTVYYLAATWFIILPIADISFGCAYLLMAVFAWAGAGSWSTDMDKNVLDDDIFDDTVPCAAGCALEAWNGVTYLFIGCALIAVGVMSLQGSAPDETTTANNQPRQPVSTSAPATSSDVVQGKVVDNDTPQEESTTADSAPPPSTDENA